MKLLAVVAFVLMTTIGAAAQRGRISVSIEVRGPDAASRTELAEALAKDLKRISDVDVVEDGEFQLYLTVGPAKALSNSSELYSAAVVGVYKTTCGAKQDACHGFLMTDIVWGYSMSQVSDDAVRVFDSGVLAQRRRQKR